jgi:hypothetical protein
MVMIGHRLGSVQMVKRESRHLHDSNPYDYAWNDVTQLKVTKSSRVLQSLRGLINPQDAAIYARLTDTMDGS